MRSIVHSLRQWREGQVDLAAVMTSDPRVREDVQALLDLSRRTGGDPAALKAAPAQARLRAVLTPVVSQQDNAGYFVLDPAGLMVPRIVDERIGDRTVSTVAEATVRALDGKPVFLHPPSSSVSRPCHGLSDDPAARRVRSGDRGPGLPHPPPADGRDPQ